MENRRLQETETIRSGTLQPSHLVSLPQQRQLVAVDGTFHHVDVVVFDAEIQISEPKDNTAGEQYKDFKVARIDVRVR